MSDRRSQQQSAANPYTAAQEAVENALKDVHTFLPGIIHSFDPVTQTAQVQPAIKRIFFDKGAVNLPLCVDVPVHFPKGGGFMMTYPIAQGDECILGFFERAIDRWFSLGGTQEPSEYRTHNLSDGFAIVGISSMPQKITAFNATDFEIRDVGRTTRITMKPDGTIENFNAVGSTILSAAGKYTINAPGGYEVIAPDTKITSASIALIGSTAVTGGFSGSGGGAFSGSVSGASGAFTGDVTAAGKSVSTHHHTEHDGFPTDGPT